MASYNRVILLGNLTRDPEVRYLPSGLAVANLGLAVNDRRKGADGKWVDEPTFVDITLFDKQAETAQNYLRKGSAVLIEGRLKLESWDGNDGQKRTKLKVVGDRMTMVGGRGGEGDEGGGGGGGGYERRGAPAGGGGRGAAPRRPSAPAAPAYDEGDYGDDAGYGGGAGGGGRYGKPQSGGDDDDRIPF